LDNKSQNLLIIFTRNIQLGKCKTRLAKTVGAEIALKIYTFLVDHTVAISKGLPIHKWVFYSEQLEVGDRFDDRVFEKHGQDGFDLGERMLNAFSIGFAKGFEKIVIIGSDIYDLREDDLKLAFEALENSDYVLGPAKDGGYYLLGMKALNRRLFDRMPWGTDKVLEKTLCALEDQNVTLLDTRNDVDVYEDIEGEEVFEKFLKDWQG
jgi:rSAM/selenodomain-associated transferase 1